MAIVVQRIEEDRTVGVECSILESDRNVIRIAGQHVAVDQRLLSVIERQRESRHAHHHVVRRDVHRVIVIPHRGG